MDPGQHPWQQRLDLLLAHRTAGHDREIQVLRKPVGLQIAFLQTGAAFENPVQPKRFIRADTPQQPAQHIVFFHHVLPQTPLPHPFVDVEAGDHVRSAGTWPSTLSRRFHRETMRPERGPPGSSRLTPRLWLSRQAATTPGASTLSVSSKWPSRL